MLQLQVVMEEYYDDDKEEFIVTTHRLRLEHSLVSLSKWESTFEKPFLATHNKKDEELFAYVMMMDLDEETPSEVFLNLTGEQYATISAYINSKQTATWFNRSTKKKTNPQTITSELIYYWITTYEIPWEVERWHISRLFTLLEVFSEENTAMQSKTGGSKTNKQDVAGLAARRQAENARRRAEMGTTG